MTSYDVTTSKAIQKRTGRTFHLATRLLPKRVRHPTYVLYGFFRLADEVVDVPDEDAPSPARQREELDRIRAAALGERETDHPVLSAFQALRGRHGLADEDIEAFIESMKMDITTDRYATHEDLATYLRGSSVSVGYMMTDVMATDAMDPEAVSAARPHAKALGEAFQLTNFLRDVREDIVEYDRIYIPRETLERAGTSEAEIERLEATPGFKRAMQLELRRTEERYREGVAGIQYLPEDCRFAVLLAAVLYADHHRVIRAQDYDVLSERPRLGRARKLSLLARTWARWRIHRDPEIVFYRVTDVPESTPSRPSVGRAVPQ